MMQYDCPHCRNSFNVDSRLAGQVIACPHCNVHIQPPIASAPQYSKQYEPEALPIEEKLPKHASRSSIDEFDNHQKISAWIAGAGLLILGLSPFFKWIKFGAGGVTGLAGDGKIVLAVTVIAAAVYTAAVIKRKWLTPVLLSVQAWGTIAAFWMGALIWKVGTIFDSPELEGNPFSAIFSTMLISPGAGLYLGLIGGIAVATALGFLAVRLLLSVGKVEFFYSSQGTACALGILVAFVVGPDRSPKSDDTALGPLFSSQTKEENVIDVQLGETFAIGNLEITPKTIELVTLNERPTFGGPIPRKSKSYVLTFVARNKSDGQVFSAYSSSSVIDNFGNECSDPTGSMSMSSVQIDGNEHLKDIRPGESANVMVAFDPALESAKEYTWTISTQISNQDEYEKWRIRFSPNDIPVE
jgi:hypothetical protein